MIVIPENLWILMLDEFSKNRDLKVEQVAYLDGVAIAINGSNNISVATTLTIPWAFLAPRRFEVQTDQMSEAGKHLRKFRLFRLAQVHTHPEGWTGHSPWDDESAYSQLPGALSIVLPHYGNHRPLINDAGIHLREAAGWRELKQNEYSEWVRVVPSFFDFRRLGQRKDREADDGTSIKSSRRKSWRGIFTFWRD